MTHAYIAYLLKAGLCFRCSSLQSWCFHLGPAGFPMCVVYFNDVDRLGCAAEGSAVLPEQTGVVPDLTCVGITISVAVN